jgi:MFS transporter, SP family, solute carrier family 2 (myo-inositol transporter), member 13
MMATETPLEKTSDFATTSLDEIVIRDQANGEISELAVHAEGEERTTWFIWLLILSSSISGLLFGTLLDRLNAI